MPAVIAMPSWPFRRHDLLRIEPDAWRDMLAAAALGEDLAAEARQLVEGWAGRGWPVMARRPAGDENGDRIAIGLPLPPSLGKLRLGFLVPAGRTVERLPAVSVTKAIPGAPTSLRPQLETLSALGASLGLRPTVFGAVLWQHVTGLPYVRPASDIDTLWPIQCRDEARQLLTALAAVDAAGPARIDGEIVLAGGEGVNWRELHSELDSADGAVVVKSMQGADLRCVRHLFA